MDGKKGRFFASLSQSLFSPTRSRAGFGGGLHSVRALRSHTDLFEFDSCAFTPNLSDVHAFPVSPQEFSACGRNDETFPLFFYLRTTPSKSVLNYGSFLFVSIFD